MRARVLRNSLWLSLLVAVVAMAPRAVGQEVSSPAVAVRSAETPKGKVVRLTYHFEEAKKDMEYAVYVPRSYDAKKATPLIIALHGLGSNPRQILGYPGMTKLAEEHGTLLGAPMGYNERGWYGNPPPRRMRSGQEDLGELSEKDVLNVLELMLENYNVDEDRIYLTGHSMGGGGTWHLGIKYPDRWAALAPIAPAIYVSADGLEKIRHLPVIVVQGDEDRLVPVEGARRWVARMKELEMTYEYLEVAGGDHIQPAFQKLPEVFGFLMKHTRKKQEQGEGEDH